MVYVLRSSIFCRKRRASFAKSSQLSSPYSSKPAPGTATRVNIEAKPLVPVVFSSVVAPGSSTPDSGPSASCTVGPPAGHAPVSVRVAPTSHQGTMAGFRLSTRPEWKRRDSPDCTGDHADCSRRAAINRPSTTPRNGTRRGPSVPMKRCGNPPAVAPSTSGYSRAGPQIILDEESPVVSPRARRARKLSPASRRSYGASPKRCGASMFPGNRGSPNRV